jgi:hypothetical protein
MSNLADKESSLDSRIKKNLLDSSKMLGCRVSEFEVKDFCKKPSHIDSYWANFAWESDENLRIRLDFEKRQAYLRQTFDGKPENVPVRWDKELPPALQFSHEGVCQLTEQDVWQFVQRFSELPQLPRPSPEKPGIMSGIILSMRFGPLERAASGAGAQGTENSILSLETEDSKLYTEKNDSSLMIYRDDESWKISFRTFQPELVGKSVSIVITDSEGKEIMREPQTLEEDEDDEVWEFEYPLPKHMNLVQLYTVDIKY